MARYKRDERDLPVSPQGKLKLRRTADGGVEIAAQPRPLTEETKAEAKPPQPDDPRSAFARNVPPHGVG